MGKELARIVIEIIGDYQRDAASNLINRISQVVMCRNPLDEPFIYTEISMNKGKTWKREDVIEADADSVSKMKSR